MNKYYKIAVIALFVPSISLAALNAPKSQTPLQPMPENTAPNINSNVNTPGNEYNTAQNEFQQQQPDENNPDPVSAQNPENVSSNDPSVKGSPSFYMILIIVCSIGLVVMLAWVIWRYKIKA